MVVTGAEDKPAREDENGFSDQSEQTPNTSFSTFINSRLLNSSSTPRSRQSSPLHSPRPGPSRFSIADRSCDSSQYDSSFLGFNLFGCFWDQKKLKPRQRVKRKIAKKRYKGLLILICLLGLFLFVNWIMLLRLQNHGFHPKARSSGNSSSSISIRVCIEFFYMGYLLIRINNF